MEGFVQHMDVSRFGAGSYQKIRPSWEDVLEALDRLSGSQGGFFNLSRDPGVETALVVWGGEGLFHVHTITDETESHALGNGEPESDDQVDFAGHTFFAHQSTRDRELVERVTKHYFLTGNRFPDETWLHSTSDE